MSGSRPAMEQAMTATISPIRQTMVAIWFHANGARDASAAMDAGNVPRRSTSLGPSLDGSQPRGASRRT
jgi:hypothetical protein